MLYIRRIYRGRVELKVTPWTVFLDWLMNIDNEDGYATWGKCDLTLGMIDYSTEYM